MSDTICGHDRALVLAALQMTNDMSDELLVVMVAGARAKGNTGPKTAVVEALLDPAKLAELMASALRARGLEMTIDTDRDNVCISVLNGDIVVEYEQQGERAPGDWSGYSKVVFALPTARTQLLAIMQTTADPSSRETCERILRGTNGV